MAADLDALKPIGGAPDVLRIERATQSNHIRDFGNILAALLTPRDQAVIRFYEAAASALLAPESPMSIYVGYLGKEPVATAELTMAGGVAGLYNISTLEVHRRKGIGSAMTLRPLLEARSQGLKTGILQAAADGVGIYTNVGFRTTGRFTEYQLPAS